MSMPQMMSMPPAWGVLRGSHELSTSAQGPYTDKVDPAIVDHGWAQRIQQENTARGRSAQFEQGPIFTPPYSHRRHATAPITPRLDRPSSPYAYHSTTHMRALHRPTTTPDILRAGLRTSTPTPMCLPAHVVNVCAQDLKAESHQNFGAPYDARRVTQDQLLLRNHTHQWS